MDKSNVQKLIEAMAGNLLGCNEKDEEVPAIDCSANYLLLTLLLRYETSTFEPVEDLIGRFE